MKEMRNTYKPPHDFSIQSLCHIFTLPNLLTSETLSTLVSSCTFFVFRSPKNPLKDRVSCRYHECVYCLHPYPTCLVYFFETKMAICSPFRKTISRKTIVSWLRITTHNRNTIVYNYFPSNSLSLQYRRSAGSGHVTVCNKCVKTLRGSIQKCLRL